MKLQVIEVPSVEPGTIVTMLAPADFIVYKEYIKEKKELEEKYRGSVLISNFLSDAFFTGEVIINEKDEDKDTKE